MRNAARGKPKPESSKCRDSFYMYARRRDAGSVRKHFRTGTEKPRDEFASNLAIFVPEAASLCTRCITLQSSSSGLHRFFI